MSMGCLGTRVRRGRATVAILRPNELRGLAQALDFHRVVGEDPLPSFSTIENAGVQQGSHIAVHRLHVPVRSTSRLTNGNGSGAAQHLPKNQLGERVLGADDARLDWAESAGIRIEFSSLDAPRKTPTSCGSTGRARRVARAALPGARGQTWRVEFDCWCRHGLSS
jgi:hypothetical protein